MASATKVRTTSFKGIPHPPTPTCQPLKTTTRLTLVKAVSDCNRADIDLCIKHIITPMREKIEDLEDDREKLQKLFLDSNTACEENAAFMQRYIEIIDEQIVEKGKLQRAMLKTQAEIEEYKMVKEDMEKYVEKYSIYEKYLENVAEVSPQDVLTVRDILERYETLKVTRANLARTLVAEMDMEGRIRQSMITLVNEETAKLKYLGNRLVMLQEAHKEAVDHRIYWEKNVQRIKNLILARKEEMDILKGACWDLYKQACHRRKVEPKAAANDIASQLEYVKKCITFYREVLNVASDLNTERATRRKCNKRK